MYENTHNQYKSELLNRWLGAWQALPQPFKVIYGMLGSALVLALIKGVKARVQSYRQSSNCSKPLNRGQIPPYEPFSTTVPEPLNDEVTDEEIQQELIRMTMSELGKRSGKARRRKALE